MGASRHGLATRWAWAAAGVVCLAAGAARGEAVDLMPPERAPEGEPRRLVDASPAEPWQSESLFGPPRKRTRRTRALHPRPFVLETVNPVSGFTGEFGAGPGAVGSGVALAEVDLAAGYDEWLRGEGGIATAIRIGSGNDTSIGNARFSVLASRDLAGGGSPLFGPVATLGVVGRVYAPTANETPALPVARPFAAIEGRYLDTSEVAGALGVVHSLLFGRWWAQAEASLDAGYDTTYDRGDAAGNFGFGFGYQRKELQLLIEQVDRLQKGSNGVMAGMDFGARYAYRGDFFPGVRVFVPIDSDSRAVMRFAIGMSFSAYY